MVGNGIRGKPFYLLATVILLNLTYPISEIGSLPRLLYVFSYTGLLGVGIYITAVNRSRLLVGISAATATVILNVYWLTHPENLAATLAALTALIVFQGFLLLVLIEYIFSVERVTHDVIFAAMSIYILIGDIFIPFYTSLHLVTLETTGSGAFVMNSAPATEITWQKLAYYSYVTLTTMGYGDITPITSTAQAFAAFEAVIGVLYLAVLIGRLVGLYSQHPAEK